MGNLSGLLSGCRLVTALLQPKIRLEFWQFPRLAVLLAEQGVCRGVVEAAAAPYGAAADGCRIATLRSLVPVLYYGSIWGGVAAAAVVAACAD